MRATMRWDRRGTCPVGIERAKQALHETIRDLGGTAEWRTLAARPARFAAWPDRLDRRVIDALGRRGIARPYTHQAEAITGALAGQDQVIVTPTASGKTLCYTLPVLQAILEGPAARALYL